jgi:hypothetical protein
MGEIRNAYKIFVEKSEGQRRLGRTRHRWKDKILEWILRKQGGKVWIGCIWLEIGTSGGGSSYEYSNDPSGSIKG